MRIALIHPPIKHRRFSENLKVVDEEFTLSPPIILAYVAAIIEKAGHNVILIDAHSLKLSEDSVLVKINSFKPDIIAFRVDTYQFYNALEWIEYLKAATGLPVLVGGINMDLYPLETMSYKAIDFGLAGEAVNSLPAFLNCLENSKDYRNIPGLYWREGETIKFNPPLKETVNFDDYPFPARHLLPNEVYHSFVSKKKNFTIMLTQTGCPYRCRFCAISAIKKFRTPAYRKRSWENVVRELEICYYDFGIREVDIFDATFFLDSERDKKICEEIRKRGLKITWTCRSRVDIAREDVLKEAAKSGLRMVFWGVESESQDILNTIHKDIRKEQTVRAINLAKKYGIKNLGFLMVGNSGDNRDSIYRTIDFAKKLGLDYVQICRTIAKPSTELDDELIKLTGVDWWRGYIAGKIEERRWPIPWSELTQEEVEDLLKKAYYRFYFRPEYILKILLNIKSVDELLRYIKTGIRMLFHYFYTDVKGFKEIEFVKSIAHMKIDRDEVDKLNVNLKDAYIVIPSFRENENLTKVLRQIFSLYPEINVVLVDSEFGEKNRFVDNLKVIYKDNLTVIHLKKHHEGNERGYAVKEGMKFALSRSARVIVEMDSDLSHNPFYIAEFLKYIQNYDIVIGSRFYGMDLRKGLSRRFLTKISNYYLRYVLGIKNVYDCTSGFRCYTRRAIETIGIDDIAFSEGSAVLVEMLYKGIKKGLSIKEFGIAYVDRVYGKSKFSVRTLKEAIKCVYYLRNKYEFIK